jgi:hypothetical protein
MKFKLLKDWGDHKKGGSIELEDKAVIFTATKLGVIDNPKGAEKPEKKEAEKGTPQAVSTQSGHTDTIAKKSKNEADN